MLDETSGWGGKKVIFQGPCQIDCPLQCDVPENVTLTEMPPSRHNWSDIVRCPNVECDHAREFLVTASTYAPVTD